MTGRVRWFRQGRSVSDGAVARFVASEPEEWCAFDSGPKGSRGGPHVGTVLCEGQVWRARSFHRTRRRGGAVTSRESVHLTRSSAFGAVLQRIRPELAD